MKVKRILDLMLVRHAINLGAIVILCTACSSFSSGLSGTETRISENPAFATEMQRRDAAPKSYPSFADAPTARPERDDLEMIMAQYEALLAERETLTDASQSDLVRGKAERADKVTMFINGRRQEVTIEEAVAHMQAARQADMAAAREQTARPMPALGGLPPKDQR